ncbi:hypothetical protein [Pseudoxanthomonas sp. 3HH-4]|uniref:hypothetical protein n=1 Tax=Pseudoxanthomonas sp. 3HH-4 TaxID=1690214 RepID=UPI00114E94B6|nr:hypothetical protein [Pseudoxanthomonas sp. 3HH-4]
MITATVGGNALILAGTLDSSASLEAIVGQAGTTPLPLDATLRVMTIYAGRSQVVIRAEPGAVWFDKFRLPVSPAA